MAICRQCGKELQQTQVIEICSDCAKENVRKMFSFLDSEKEKKHIQDIQKKKRGGWLNDL